MKKNIAIAALAALCISPGYGLRRRQTGKRSYAAADVKTIVVAVNEAPWLPGFRAP
jgi:hypothetical protein